MTSMKYDCYDFETVSYTGKNNKHKQTCIETYECYVYYEQVSVLWNKNISFLVGKIKSK